MKKVMTVAERFKENEELLTMENANKIIIAEVAKLSSTIDLESKHGWVISNTDIDAAGDLRLIDI